jgi:hypothetical protein
MNVFNRNSIASTSNSVLSFQVVNCHLQPQVVIGCAACLPPIDASLVSEARTVMAHIPVTDAMSEVPNPISPSPTADAAEFPLLEETHLAIPSRRVKHNAENKAVRERQWRQVPGATGPSPTPQPMPDTARVVDDDGHIPLHSSRIRPLFMSVATQKVVAQHQKATTTGNQARAVQGHSKAGHLLWSVGRNVRRGRWGVCPECRQRVERICRAISKQVQRSNAGIEVDVMHTRWMNALSKRRGVY